MLTVICNPEREKYIRDLLKVCKNEKLEFICSPEELYISLPKLSNSLSTFIIEVALFWNQEDVFLSGINLAKWLRREHFFSAPIIFISPRNLDKFNPEEEGIIKSQGSGFIPLRFTYDILDKQLKNTKHLSDSELKNVVILHCDLIDTWKTTSHKIGGLLKYYKQNYSEIKAITKHWAESINHFAPEHQECLKEFQTLLNKPVQSVNVGDLKQAKQNLDEALKGKKPYDFSKIEVESLPKFPPKVYSKILIYDYEHLDSLISCLKSEYRYTIVGQAQGSKEAERLLNEKKPNVVLSDYYFKKYARDKTTDKKFGGNFMISATNFNIGSPNHPENPIVAVISKTSLDKEDIPPGVLDFSGSLNATNPKFVHSGIWLEAIKRGVTEPEIIEGQNWALDYQYRQRLEPYKFDLPKIIRQWHYFKNTIQETLDMVRSLPPSKYAEDSKLIKSIKDTLEPFENAEDFSLKEVSEIFVKVENDHKKAKQPPESEVKTQIRNILHGKIEQFSSVTNHINFALEVFAEISSDLTLLPEYKKIGVKFKKKLDDFRDNKPLLPLLHSFHELLSEILELLPEIPEIKNPVKAKNSVLKKIHILIVEDDKFWSETVKSAVETVQRKLGDNFQVTYEYFDNVEKASKAVPVISQTPNKKEFDETLNRFAIIDICLPENSKKGQIPNPENGIKLINALSEYTSNVPVIVFSTKASLLDRRVIGRLGIPDGNFIAKDYDAESAITETLISLIEKKEKYIIRRVPYKKNGVLSYDYLINGLQVPLTTELNLTFEALYNLKVDKKYENQVLFSAEEINKKRLLIKGEETNENQKNPVRSHIYDIRKLIHEVFRRNNRYIDTRELIKTIHDDDESFYELNADLPLPEDDNLLWEEEDDLSWEEEDDDDDLQWEDYEKFKSKVFNILVIGENAVISKQITETLELKSEIVFKCKPSEDVERIAETFCPDIVCTELSAIETWNRVRTVLPSKRLGIIVTATNEEENRLVQKAIKSGIPIVNFVSINEQDWINSFLTKLNNEKQRVFLGKIDDSLNSTKEPIVKVLKGSNLSEGKLRLQVNNRLFTPNRSNQSKILSYLLQNPRTLISLDTIKKDVLGIESAVPDNYLNKLVERIRTQIQENWLNTDERELAMHILESSAKGMQLNVQVISPQGN